MKTAPEYSDEASIIRQPNPTDQDEQRIVGLLGEGMMSTPWAQALFQAKLKPLLVNYFKESLDRKEDVEYVHNRTQEVLKQFAELSNSQIVEGKEHLEGLKGKSVFLLTNHLGTYKLLGLDPKEDLGHPEIALPVLHPFPAFYGSLYPVAEALGDGLYQSAHDYPDPVRGVQLAAGSLILPPGKSDTLGDIEASTKELLDSRSQVALTIFPEGGTSGKRNNGGPYSLERFRTGSLVIAGDLGVPAIPIAQYFDPREGFKLRVFPPLNLKPSEGDESRGYFQEQASGVQEEMQGWLNTQVANSSSSR